MRDGEAGEIDLAHQLVVEAVLEIGGRQLGQRLVGGAAGGGDHRVDGADGGEQGLDAGDVLDVRLVGPGARGADDFVAEGDRAATTALPMVPVAPTTSIFMMFQMLKVVRGVAPSTSFGWSPVTRGGSGRGWVSA